MPVKIVVAQTDLDGFSAVGPRACQDFCGLSQRAADNFLQKQQRQRRRRGKKLTWRDDPALARYSYRAVMPAKSGAHQLVRKPPSGGGDQSVGDPTIASFSARDA
jgi:hypothetical protein